MLTKIKQNPFTTLGIALGVIALIVVGIVDWITLVVFLAASLGTALVLAFVVLIVWEAEDREKRRADKYGSRPYY